MSSKKVIPKTSEVQAPQQRIKELEKENTLLKNRLEELRKAKLQTIIKKEGRTIPKGPNLGRKTSNHSSDESPSPETNVVIQSDPKLEEDLKKYKSRVKELEKELSEIKEAHQSELATAQSEMLSDMKALRDAHMAEIAKLSGDYNRDLDSKMAQLKKFREGFLSDSSSNNDHDKQTIEKLQQENKELTDETRLQASQISKLEARVRDSLTELSEKEAAWCELEEKLKIQIQKSWGEKYQAWMVATEKKIDELRKTNEFLKSALERQNPSGLDS